MNIQKSLLTATLLILGGFAAMTANAAENPVTGEFQVSVEVQSVCNIKTAGDITLDAVKAGLASEEATKTATLTLNCSEGAVPVISLTPSSASIDGTGVMTGGVSKQEVKYRLTSGSAAGTVWGSGDNAVTLAAAKNYATAIDTTIYATVTDTADVKPDTYSDTINVSVAY
ncbi:MULTISPECIES: spore coat protein U domain-containing protein [unclassified Psychrobacter]|uniref:spore coat protein U domain-containing protein n=1 Tax=unclassified Psychrobacter TaxID=196806 RepID=UPI0025CBA5AE|nr:MULTISPECIES: spore coat protein U domain-containing protein [unclassified Psychrobacter]